VQNEQRHDLVGEKRSDYLRGQPRGEWLLSELLNKITAKRNSSSSATNKTASVTASTRTRSSSLAAISADSARSNAESIAEIFTGAKLNRRKRVLEVDCRPIRRASAKANDSTLSGRSGASQGAIAGIPPGLPPNTLMSIRSSRSSPTTTRAGDAPFRPLAGATRRSQEGRMGSRRFREERRFGRRCQTRLEPRALHPLLSWM
jgi:hypothetical protein